MPRRPNTTPPPGGWQLPAGPKRCKRGLHDLTVLDNLDVSDLRRGFFTCKPCKQKRNRERQREIHARVLRTEAAIRAGKRVTREAIAEMISFRFGRQIASVKDYWRNADARRAASHRRYQRHPTHGPRVPKRIRRLPGWPLPLDD